MLILLKDVELSEVEDIIERVFPDKSIRKIVRDSDFLENRKGMLAELKCQNSNTSVLCIYDMDYLKWSLIYYYGIYISSRGRSYIIDTLGNVKRVNLFYLTCCGIFSFFSVLKQIWQSITYRIKLRKLRRIHRPTFFDNKRKHPKIAYIRTTDTYNLRAGGSLGHTVGIIEGFKENGVSVDYFAIDDIKQVSVNHKVIVKPSRYMNLLNIFNRYDFNRKFTKKIQKEFKSTNYSFIYQRASRDNFSGAELSKAFGVPLVLEFNSFLAWELEGANHFVHKLFTKPTIDIEKFNLEAADLIVVVSEALKKQLIDSGISGKKIIVTPNAVDARRFYDKEKPEYLMKELNIDHSSPVIGFSGTFGFWHGIDILAEALKQIAGECKDCKFLLIGDGPYRKTAEENLIEFDNVIFTGSVPYEKMPDYLNLCDILLSPHNVPKGEVFIGSPTKLFEYMASGKIIIASALDQIDNVIKPAIDLVGKRKFNLINEDNKSVGIKVEPGNVSQLADSIMFSIKHLSDLDFLGVNAREAAVDKHSWQAATSKILSYLKTH